MKIGIPRALLYYYYYPLWAAFFRELGTEVVVSTPTNKEILNKGARKTVDEACLPVKVYFGHVLDLAPRVHRLFIPRLISVEEKAYICPKLIGLPDMLRAAIPKLPELIDIDINLRRSNVKLQETFYNVGKKITKNPFRVQRAWKKAQITYEKFLNLLQQGFLPTEAAQSLIDGKEIILNSQDCPRVAVLGHGYNIYDRYLSMDLIGKLRDYGVQVETPDMLPCQVIEEEMARFPKRLFWTLGKKLLGGTCYFLRRKDIDGIIQVSSFGCGPDSLIGDLAERRVRWKRKIPFLSLTLDEHSGEAGINTRLEAFMDMIAWRRTG